MQDDPDTGAVALCALRYCLGRRTYMPSLIIDWVKRHWESFPLNDRERILKDLEREINSGFILGDSCDVATWLDFRDWMARKIRGG